MKKIIKNLTPHAIVVANQDQTITIEPSGLVARIDLVENKIGELHGFPVYSQSLVGHNLPEEEEGVILLVSAMVLAEAKKLNRKDCVAPNTNAATRNEKGHIVSVPGFVS